MLCLKLSDLPDSKKRHIVGVLVEPSLFGPAIALMQQLCDDKKENEALKLAYEGNMHRTRPPLCGHLIPLWDAISRTRADQSLTASHKLSRLLPLLPNLGGECPSPQLQSKKSLALLPLTPKGSSRPDAQP